MTTATTQRTTGKTDCVYVGARRFNPITCMRFILTTAHEVDTAHVDHRSWGAASTPRGASADFPSPGRGRRSDAGPAAQPIRAAACATSRQERPPRRQAPPGRPAHPAPPLCVCETRPGPFWIRAEVRGRLGVRSPNVTAKTSVRGQLTG